MFIHIVAEEPDLIAIVDIPDVIRIDLVHIEVELAIITIADELERNL